MLVRRSWALVLTAALLCSAACGHRAYRIVTRPPDRACEGGCGAIGAPQDPIGRLRAVRAAYTALTTTTVAAPPPTTNETAPPVVPPDYHDAPDWPTWRAIGRCEQPGPGADGIAWTHHGSYNGGLGILNSSWTAFNDGLPDHAYDATPAQQLTVARRIRARYGYSGWTCARRMGL